MERAAGHYAIGRKQLECEILSYAQRNKWGHHMLGQLITDPDRRGAAERSTTDFKTLEALPELGPDRRRAMFGGAKGGTLRGWAGWSPSREWCMPCSLRLPRARTGLRHD